MRTLAQALLGLDPWRIPIEDLIAVLISDRVRQPRAAAQQLVAEVQGDLRRLGDVPVLEAVGANDPIVRARLVAVTEISRRISLIAPLGQTIGGPAEAVRVFEPICRGSRVELLLAAYLDVRGRVLGVRTLSSGTDSYSVVSPSMVLREALLLHARTIILAHNHPSLDPEPSSDDIRVTRAIGEAAKVLGLHLADHVIIGTAGRYVSLAERGLLV